MTAFTPEAARALGGPDWLVERRLAAAEQLDGIAWPTPSEELWRYSCIDELDLDRFRPPSPEELGEPGPELAPGGGPVAAEAGERAGLVVARNGRVVHHELDETLARKGVRVCGLATCDEADVGALLGACSLASPDPFTVLHDAFLAGGAFIRGPAGVVVEKPIIVLHWSEGDGLTTFPHTLVAAEESSELTVLDRFGSPDTGDAGHLVDAVVELMVADNARVRYLSVQEHGPHTWQIALQRAHVGRDASLHSSAVALGGDHTQMLDFRTLQDHDAPNTRSDLLFKGAVEDQAHSVYSGLIRLRPSARKAVANQTNRNLVLTEGAGAESIPNLEIEANDVKCSHASAVGPIDEDQLYYLESRGVPPAEAERLIVFGFFDDVLERLPLPTLVQALRRTVVEKVEHRRG